MSCKSCKNYSELKEPRIQKNKDGAEYTIAGYCFKKSHQADYNKGYPVFIPEGTCKGYQGCGGRPKEDVQIDGQMDLFTDYPGMPYQFDNMTGSMNCN